MQDRRSIRAYLRPVHLPALVAFAGVISTAVTLALLTCGDASEPPAHAASEPPPHPSALEQNPPMAPAGRAPSDRPILPDDGDALLAPSLPVVPN